MIETEASKEMSDYLLQAFKDALELGSLIQVEQKDYDSYKQFIDEVHSTAEFSIYSLDWMENTYYQINKLIKQAEILSEKYCVTTTNPPYLNKMSGELKKYVVKNYKDYSSDLFAVFVKRNFDFTKESGYLGFMTPFVWMFIKSYEKLREYIINNKAIATLVQMEYSAYEEATVPICSFVLKNEHSNNLGYYFRLSDFKGGMEVQKQKVLEALSNKECGYFYETSSSNFTKIPGSPIAYWGSVKFIKSFEKYKTLQDMSISRAGLSTGNNDKYMRLWFEPLITHVAFNMHDNDEYLNSQKKYVPCNKGGAFRRWYGNNDYIIDWTNPNSMHRPRTTYMDLYYKSAITWSAITSSLFNSRYYGSGFLFDHAAASLFLNELTNVNYILGLLNTKVTQYILSMINPTINTGADVVAKIPIKFIDENKVTNIVQSNINNCKTDWDSFETSWDFKVHPLVELRLAGASAWGDNAPSARIVSAYKAWSIACEERFN